MLNTLYVLLDEKYRTKQFILLHLYGITNKTNRFSIFIIHIQIFFLVIL